MWKPQITPPKKTPSNSKKCENSRLALPPPWKNIPASSSPTLIWSGCVGLSIINVPEENRRSPFTPPRHQHNNRKTTERGLSVCLAGLEAVVYWAADQGNQTLGGSEAAFTMEEADESIQTVDKCFNLCKQTDGEERQHKNKAVWYKKNQILVPPYGPQYINWPHEKNFEQT